MAIEEFKQLDMVQVDALMEVGNIGSGNAATALSTMLNCRIMLNIPSVRLLDFEKTPQYLGGPHNQVIGVMVRVTGDIKGMMFHAIQKDFVNKLLGNFLGQQLDSLNDIDDMGRSVISEVANITSATYVNALAQMTGLMIDILPPEQFVEEVGKIIEIPQKELSDISKQVLLIDQNLLMDKEEVRGNMIFIPQAESLNVLLGKLGIKI